MNAKPRPIYMDHNATTPALPEVLEAMLPYFGEEFGNPSSSHVFGRRAAAAVEEARGRVARLIGASPKEIVFTAGATESDNLALRGIAAPGGRGHLVTCAIEHEAVLETCAGLRPRGYDVTVMPVDRHGLVDPGDLAGALRADTVLVSVMMANNEIGTIEPIGEIGRLCRQRGVPLHTDAVQAAGRVPIDVRALGVDLLSLTAHKMYGPKGIGALYVREGLSLDPMIAGGGQEGKLRSGTLNVPGIVGFGVAADIALRDLEAESAREAALRDRLWQGIRSRCGDVSLNGHPTHRLPNNLSVAFNGIEAEALLTALRDVVAFSSGSACASGTGKGSYVIRATGDEAAARCSVRFGLGRSTTAEQVARVVDHLETAAERLRKMAPGGAMVERTAGKGVN